MQRFSKILFLLLFVELLLLTPFFLIAELHTTFYSAWTIFSGHSSLFYSVTELLIAQQSLMENLFSSLPSSLTFTERELLHLQDIVYILIGFYVYIASQVAILGVLLFSRSARDFFMTSRFRKQVSFILGGIILVSVGSLQFSFDTIFISLHRSIFSNEYWLLSKEALLINIYPPQFFSHMLFIALTLSLFLYIIIIAISILLERQYENKI